MRIPLQELGFKDSAYERPNQDWVCGWAVDGKPCMHGPDGDGQCTAHAQATCHPASEGDRWVCTRAEAFGGACTNGPKPDGNCSCPTPEYSVCQPRRSMRAKRGRLVVLVAAFTFGFLLLMLGGPWQQSFVSPGELSSVHLAIENADGEENCITCHQAGNMGLGSWLKMALNVSDGITIHNDSGAQCLTCHFTDNSTARVFAMAVHGRSSDSLQALTQEKIAEALGSELGTDMDSDIAAVDVETSEIGSNQIVLMGKTTAQLLLADLIHGDVENTTGDIACASCHQDHRGADHDLTLLGDAQCQSCHIDSFESFNVGHPEFTQVPKQSGGILFDHAEHQGRFESEELNCANCHTSDAMGRTMQVSVFEDACEGCHEQGSEDHHGDAIKKNPLFILQLPEIEFEDEEYWPLDYAYGEFLTPMMAMLLAGDDEALPLLVSIYDEDGAAGDLYEWLIETEDNDEPELKVELALALKRLVAELADYSEDGEQARIDRLAKALGTTNDDRYVQSLAVELSSANFVMQSFQQRYLPQLSDDLAGEEVYIDDDVQPESEWMTSSSMSGWRVDSDDGSISYRPLTHGDSLLKSWMDALKTHSTKISEINADDIAGETRREILTGLYSELEPDFNTCTKCHTEEEQGINWNAAGRAEGSSGYAKFNHSPHIAMLPGQNDCVSCHVLNTDDNASTISELSAPRGFLPHQNERCESCHAPGRANNTCLNCHQYHEFKP